MQYTLDDAEFLIRNKQKTQSAYWTMCQCQCQCWCQSQNQIEVNCWGCIMYTAPFHWACALRWRAKMTTNIVIFCTALFISFCIPVPVQAGTAHGTSFIWASIELSLRCMNAINGHNLIPLFPFAAAANFFRFYSRSKFTYRLIHIYYLHKWPLRNTATYILVQRQQCKYTRCFIASL